MRMHGSRIGVPLIALLLVVGACTPDVEHQADDGIERIGSDDAGAVDDAPSESDAEARLQPDPDPQFLNDPEPLDSPAQDPEPEPGPAGIDITVIPDEITAEYVEAVLVELERIYAEAYAIVRDEQELTIEITNRVGSIFSESQIDSRYGEFRQLAEQPELLRASENIEPRTRGVFDLLAVSKECVWVETLSDPSGLSPESQKPGLTFVLMRPKEVERPVDLNSTPWVYERLRTPINEADEHAIRLEQPCLGG